MSTRTEHITWCKDRALAYVDAGEPGNALASIMSDLRKHPGTADHGAIELGAMLMMAGHLQSAQDVREWIEGVQ